MSNSIELSIYTMKTPIKPHLVGIIVQADRSADLLWVPKSAVDMGHDEVLAHVFRDSDLARAWMEQSEGVGYLIDGLPVSDEIVREAWKRA